MLIGERPPLLICCVFAFLDHLFVCCCSLISIISVGILSICDSSILNTKPPKQAEHLLASSWFVSCCLLQSAWASLSWQNIYSPQTNWNLMESMWTHGQENSTLQCIGAILLLLQLMHIRQWGRVHIIHLAMARLFCLSFKYLIRQVRNFLES